LKKKKMMMKDEISEMVSKGQLGQHLEKSIDPRVLGGRRHQELEHAPGDLRYEAGRLRQAKHPVLGPSQNSKKKPRNKKQYINP